MTPPDGAPSTWSASYWDDDDPWIFEEEARDYVERLRAALPLAPDQRVLDFGCGFGFVARLLAPHVATVAVWDASPAMRRRARATLAGFANATFLDPTAQPTPPDAVFDRILVNSVVQYMTRAELAGWLPRWRSLLAAHGGVVVSDVWPPDAGVAAETRAIVAFALRQRIVTRTILGGLRRWLRHRALERTRPLLRLDPSSLAAMARAAGLDSAPLARNLTYRRGRFSVVLAEAR